MYTNILIAIDIGRLDDAALGEGLVLCRQFDARAVLLGLHKPQAAPMADFPNLGVGLDIEDAARRAIESTWRQVFGRAQEMAISLGVDITAIEREPGIGWQSVLDAVQQHHCDAVVIGAGDGHAVTRLLTGNPVPGVITRAGVPVIVVRALSEPAAQALGQGRSRPGTMPPPETGVTVRPMQPADVESVVTLQHAVYPEIDGWSPRRLLEQLSTFPQGQIVAESAGRVIGYAGSLIVLWDDWVESHTWHQITGAGTFDQHNPAGRTLYGAEIFVAPDERRNGIGHALYEARRRLCRDLNLRRIIACGRLPGYHEHAATMSPDGYARRVVWGDLEDPILSFQLREGFRYCGVITDYLPQDRASLGCASIIVWLNPDHDPSVPTRPTRAAAAGSRSPASAHDGQVV